MFLSAFESANGDTLFQLTPPAVGFVKRVSENLPFIGTLRKKIGHLKREGGKDNPRDASVIVSLRSLLAQGRPEAAVAVVDQISKDDPVLVNPKVNALFGQALSELGAQRREDARAAFRVAESMSYRDIYMLRSWFNLEFVSGYNLPEAKRICQSFLDDARFGPRDRSEIYSKLGSCLNQDGIAISNASREKALIAFRASVTAYMEAMWIGQELKTLNIIQTLTWSEKPLQRLVQMAGLETEEFLQLLEDLADKGHDIQSDGADVLVQYLGRLPRSDLSNFKNRLRGFAYVHQRR